MAKTTNRLNVLSVQRAKPGFHPDGAGLYLKVNESGSRSWVLRYQVDGRERYMGLGGYPVVSLAMARQAALEAKRQRAGGADPIDARRATRAARGPIAAPSFLQLAREVIAQREPGWKNQKSAQAWRLTLLDYCRPIHRTAVDQIDTQAVLNLLQPYWTTRPETANRLRQRVEIVIDYAAAKGHVPLDRGNPARWSKHLQRVLPARPERGRHAAMPYDQVPAFFAGLVERDTPASLALRWIILTAARSAEGRGARWQEIDQARGIWTVPGARMKTGRDHLVPLSTAALEILRQAGEVRRSPLIFEGWRLGRPLTDMAFTGMLPTGCTTHGFRTSFKTWALEQTDFENALSELALSHSVGSIVERAYARTTMIEKRRSLMQLWGDFCMRQNVATTDLAAEFPLQISAM